MKTRNAPSANAVKRAKGLDLTKLHPIFASNSQLLTQFNFIEQLKSFRPKHTILEEDGKNGTKQERKSQAQLAMEEKRRADQEKITMRHKKRNAKS